MRWLALLLAVAALVAVVAIGARVGRDLLRSEPLDRTGGETAPEGDVAYEGERATEHGPVLHGRPPPPAEPETPLEAGESGVFGRVFDARSGAPVPGVRVEVMGGRDVLATATSDEKGAYRAPHLPTRRWRVTVLVRGGGWLNEAQGRARFERGDFHAMAAELAEGRWVPHDVPVLPAARLVGRVVEPDGAPVRGAEVEVVATAGCTHTGFGWTWLDEVRSDEEGRFAFEALPPARGLCLMATRDTGHPASLEVPPLLPGDTVEVEVAFPALRSLAVRVVDGATGRAVQDADVGIGWGGFEWPARGSDEGTTDATGRIVFEGVPEAPVAVSVEAEGYRTFEGDEEEGFDGTIHLHPVQWISGRVLLPPGIDTMYVAARALDAPGHEEWEDGARTATDGRFRVPVPGPGLYHLEVDYRSDAALWEGHAEAEAGATGVVLELVRGWRASPRTEPPAPDLASWRITILGPDGLPLKRAYLDVETPHPGGLERPGAFPEDATVTVKVRTDAVGAWLDVDGADTATGVEAGAMLFGPFGPSGGEATVRLPPPRTITGRVLRTDGTPAQCIDLQATVVRPPDMPATWRLREVHDYALTDAEGRFALTGLGAEAYVIDADHRNGPFVVPIQVRPPAEGVVVRLLPRTELTIRDPDGRAIADAMVRVFGVQRLDEGGDVRSPLCEEETDAEGRASFALLEPGAAYTLSVHPPWEAHLDVQPLWREGWRARSEEIVLARGLPLRGRVVTSGGDPVPHAWVALDDGKEEPDETEADGAGRFAFHGLAPGRYRLGVSEYVSVDGEQPAPVWTCEAEAGDEDVVVELPSRRELTVTVARLHTAFDTIYDLRLTRVVADGERAPSVERDFPESSVVVFRGLEAAASYWVWGGPTDTGRYVHARVPPQVEEVRLAWKHGATITGHVTWPEGGTRPYVVSTDRGVYLDMTARRDGTFEIAGVPPGTWTLVATTEIDGRPITATATAEAGGHVEIHIPRR